MCASYLSYAQDYELIKSDTSYVYGEGWGTCVEEAKKNAIADLISRISISVSSSSLQTMHENFSGGELDSKVDFSATIETYSNATLTNAQLYTISNGPDAHVIGWIKKSEIRKMFEFRKAKILDYVESAIRYTNNGKIDNALRRYWWAMLMLKTLQYPDELTYTDPEGDGKSHILINWIPEQIELILDKVEAKIVKKEDTDFTLFITYDQKPIASIDYTYWDGTSWSNIYSAKDGYGVLEVSESYKDIDNIRLKYEYEYRSQAHTDPDIAGIMKSSPNNISIKNAFRDIPSTISKVPKVSKIEDIATSNKTETNEAFGYSTAIIAPPKQIDNPRNLKQIMNNLLTAIEEKKYNEADSLFTPDGLDIFNKLLTYGNARIVGKPDYTFYKYGNETVARGGQMAFSFKGNLRKSFVEDVVFTFDEHNKINNISFGLGNEAKQHILYKGLWNDTARIALMSFLENYKTAYALKRLDYIETIFDDDAVIITGKYVSKPNITSPNEEITLSVDGNKIIQYNRMNKDQFLRHLKMCFDGKEFINIRFADNRVRKMASGGELYAIEIAQDYYSSNYGDKGYLFLMVDINNPKQPIIKVRTWQPEKDPKFGLYGPGDFQ